MNDKLIGWVLIFLSALLDSYAAFIVKTKFNELGKLDFSSFKAFFDYIFQFLQSPILLTAIIAFVSAPGLWFLALNRINLSTGYPMLVGFHLVFVLIFGVFFLAEDFDVYKGIGTVLVLFSLFFFAK